MATGSGNISSVANIGLEREGGSTSLSLPVSGNITFKDMIALVGWSNIGDANAFRLFQSAKSAGAQAQYQVTTGKTFYATGLLIHFSVPSAVMSFDLGYGTAALAADGTATPPTGSILYAGDTGDTGGQGIYGVLGGANTVESRSSTFIPLCGVSFPALSYPYLYIRSSGDGAGITMIGYEEA